jgi:hypothetical protein
MAQNTELQERYSALVEAKLRATSVFAHLFNNRYEGSPKAGAVKVPVRAEATVGDYNIANGGTLATPTTTYATIVTDNDHYVNELIDGYVAAAVPDGLIADRLDSAGAALADKIDVMLAAKLVTDGTAMTGSGTASTKSNIYSNIIDAIQQAAALKVAKTNMRLAISNAAYGLLLKSDEFVRATAGDLEKFGAGFVGLLGGVPVYETPNLPANTEFVLFNNDFCHYVAEWAVPVAVNDLADGKHIGASAVQGRQVWGALISKPATVLYRKSA